MFSTILRTWNDAHTQDTLHNLCVSQLHDFDFGDHMVKCNITDEGWVGGLVVGGWEVV